MVGQISDEFSNERKNERDPRWRLDTRSGDMSRATRDWTREGHVVFGEDEQKVVGRVQRKATRREAGIESQGKERTRQEGLRRAQQEAVGGVQSEALGRGDGMGVKRRAEARNTTRGTGSTSREIEREGWFWDEGVSGFGGDWVKAIVFRRWNASGRWRATDWARACGDSALHRRLKRGNEEVDRREMVFARNRVAETRKRESMNAHEDGQELAKKENMLIGRFDYFSGLREKSAATPCAQAVKRGSLGDELHDVEASELDNMRA
ncbi:hypothetical protein BKA62DRAFT_760674 [Auriculariales sp. MPI-PUGE-AT-0066]|nr:hypothetical protein BKA62DRAFT_760674 [Auriculariales sp. MPI-PUGE-AT-0066]